jgi:hypothetical protein
LVITTKGQTKSFHSRDQQEDPPELLRPLAGEVEDRLGDDDRHGERDGEVEDQDDKDVAQRLAEDRVLRQLAEVGQAHVVVDAEAVPVVERLLEHQVGRPVLEDRQEDERRHEERVDQAHPPDPLRQAGPAPDRGRGGGAG